MTMCIAKLVHALMMGAVPPVPGVKLIKSRIKH